tara:strand:+ start:266 stop:514 length:249 start_codon:yes stop_codon:yes gene_type:complete
MTNYIEKLNMDIQGYIGRYLAPQTDHDWNLACQGDDIVNWVIEEMENEEDLTKDWRDDGRGDWEDDFDLHDHWDETDDDYCY